MNEQLLRDAYKTFGTSEFTSRQLSEVVEGSPISIGLDMKKEFESAGCQSFDVNCRIGTVGDQKNVRVWRLRPIEDTSADHYSI